MVVRGWVGLEGGAALPRRPGVLAQCWYPALAELHRGESSQLSIGPEFGFRTRSDLGIMLCVRSEGPETQHGPRVCWRGLAGRLALPRRAVCAAGPVGAADATALR